MPFLFVVYIHLNRRVWRAYAHFLGYNVRKSLATQGPSSNMKIRVCIYN